MKSKALLWLAVLLFCIPTISSARVKEIVIDETVSPAFDGESYGSVGQYETIAGRVFGELDPNDPINAIITDIKRASTLNAEGKVTYVANFFLVKPIDMSKSSHLMWQDVPNRGSRNTIPVSSREDGDIGLSSGWQGDNSGRTAQSDPTRMWAVVPVASGVTGVVMGRIMNVGGLASQPIIEHSNPLAYQPMTLDTTKATLESHDHETSDGIVSGVHKIASSDWAWARCNNGVDPDFPGTPDPTQICVKGGFLPDKLYQVVFKAKDPYILAVGTAAFRDMASFFRYEEKDDLGNPNPLANQVKWIITRGRSQSGTFIRQLIHFGFTQDDAKRKVYDGAWPIIAARRIALNFRFAKPDLVMKLYEAGSEGPLWWSRWPDKVRHLPPGGILDRCKRTRTCPKIMEHFGAAEVWGQKLTAGWVGTDAKADIPLPHNLRRYYFASSPHGGGPGGFDENPASAPNCSGTNYGPGTFPRNPMPQTETVNALVFHFRNWVMHGTRPPDSVYPTLAKKQLVFPTKKALKFPDNIPDVLASSNPDAPFEDQGSPFIMAMLQYYWGRHLDYSDNTGFHDFEPPIVKRVIDQVVPQVDADGNEIGGVPVVLLQAPLATYLGWNITASGFHQGQVCNYQGGMIPFPKTYADRMASGDPRLSLQERYCDHDGYVEAVEAAVEKTKAAGFLLEADAEALIEEAKASNVLVDVPYDASVCEANDDNDHHGHHHKRHHKHGHGVKKHYH